MRMRNHHPNRKPLPIRSSTLTSHNVLVCSNSSEYVNATSISNSSRQLKFYRKISSISPLPTHSPVRPPLPSPFFRMPLLYGLVHHATPHHAFPHLVRAPVPSARVVTTTPIKVEPPSHREHQQHGSPAATPMSEAMPVPPPVQITFGGRARGVTHGLADFVAQEEMHRYRGFWWSLDSASIAFTEVCPSSRSFCLSSHLVGSVCSYGYLFGRLFIFSFNPFVWSFVHFGSFDPRASRTCIFFVPFLCPEISYMVHPLPLLYVVPN